MFIAKTKKGLSLLLAIFMVFTMMPLTIFSFGADASAPVMYKFNAASSDDFHAYYRNVYSVTFLDYIDTAALTAADTVVSWDVSDKGDGSVMAWMKKNDVETTAAGADRYDVYVGGEGGVQSHENTTHMFYAFSALEEVSGLENFYTGKVKSFEQWFASCGALENIDLGALDTSSVKSFKNMFRECRKLLTVNLHGWDTSNATDMSYMFYNCVKLQEVDLRNFDTSKVTTMYFMFYRAGELTNIYIGSGWTNESIANLNESVFNCCYAIRGGKEEYEKNPQESAYYATAKPEGNLEIRFKVEYEFTGDVPEGVEPPETAYYEKNADATVETTPVVPEGYIFTGWSTEDVTVTDSGFTVTDDVLFTGEWSRVYKVNYIYIGEVPAGADPTPATKEYKAGETVTVEALPGKVGDYTFVGWSCDDVVTTGGDFTMPAHDVTLYGYFKIPVSGVVINTGNIILNENDETKIEITVNPEDATIKDVIYESGDDTIVTVDEDGNVTAVGEGTTTIRVTSADDPNKFDEITVTVKKPVTEVTLEKEKTIIDINTSEDLVVTVNPDNATNKELIWESGDDTIVTVDENGKITAVGEGTTTVKVISADDPTKFDIITVKVEIPVEGIVIENDDTEVAIGEELQLNVTVNPETASVKDLEYTSSDETVAIVDEFGKVTPVGEGTTVITVTSKDNPEITETITITVVMYKVTYAFIGDVIPEGAVAPDGGKYGSGAEVIVEEAASAEGYIFSGWSTEDYADIKDGRFNIYNDVHFVGSWTKINYYDVTYKYEGDVPANAPAVPGDATYEEGTTVYVEAEPTLDGYIFTGWETKDVTVADGEFDIYNDVEFVGKWEKIINYYDVTYKYEGTVPANAPALPDGATYEEGTTVYVEAEPTLDGYIFTGWETKDVTVADGEFDIYNDVEFVGKWEKVINYYDVTYKYEGEVPAGATPPETKSYKEGTKVTVAENPSADGYTFLGWDKEGTFEINEDVVIVGKWEKIINYYDVTYKYEGTVPAGAPEVPDAATYEEGTTVYVEAEPTLDGYIFTGWETKDVTVADGKFDIYNDVEFVGKWEKKINYYKVTYKYKGDVPVNAPVLPDVKTYEEGSEVIIAAVPSFTGYEFSGWTTSDADISGGRFNINNDVVIVGRWTMKPGAVTSIVVPEDFTMVKGEEAALEAYVNGSASNKGVVYTIVEGDSVELDADGNVKAVGAGKTKIKISAAGNPEIYGYVTITVYADSAFGTKHYIVFGRTEHIGWYNVSLDGGETFFPVYGNSHLEVEHGTEVIIKARDMVGDPFTFYVNGTAMDPDEDGYIRVVADKYLLIGALGIPVEAPDVEESVSLFQRFINAIKAFFEKIANLFKF